MKTIKPGNAHEGLRSLGRGLRKTTRGARLYSRNGSWRALFHILSHNLRRMAGQTLPQVAFLVVTYRCQCNCPHCYAEVGKRRSSEDISTEELKSRIDQVKALGVYHLVFTGGEPLLRDDLVELVAHAHQAGLISRLSTNGFLLDCARVNELKRAGLNQCGVAVDDADRDTHERLRGLPGLFERAVEGFRLLDEAGIESRLMTYARHDTLSEGMDRIIELGGRLGVKTVHINIPYASGCWAESYDEVFSEEEMDALRRLQASVRKPEVLLEFPTPNDMCLALKMAGLYIKPQGDVTPCPVIPYAIGNMRNESLSAIWKRHTDALEMNYRGICPMTRPETKDGFRKHSERVNPGHSGSGKA